MLFFKHEFFINMQKKVGTVFNETNENNEINFGHE